MYISTRVCYSSYQNRNGKYLFFLHLFCHQNQLRILPSRIHGFFKGPYNKFHTGTSFFADPSLCILALAYVIHLIKIEMVNICFSQSVLPPKPITYST